MRLPCCKEIAKLTVVDYICRSVVFGDPLDK
jgi:hypothetical protein